MERSNPAHQDLSGRSPALSSRSNPRMRSACFVASHSFAAFLVGKVSGAGNRRPASALVNFACHLPDGG